MRVLTISASAEDSIIVYLLQFPRFWYQCDTSMGWTGNEETKGRLGTTQNGLFIFLHYSFAFSNFISLHTSTHTLCCSALFPVALISPLFYPCHCSLKNITLVRKIPHRCRMCRMCPYHSLYPAPPSIHKLHSTVPLLPLFIKESSIHSNYSLWHSSYQSVEVICINIHAS